MAVRQILKYPDPRLREPGRPVGQVSDEIRRLIDDMAETMYAAPGCGLAAPQIGVSLRIFVDPEILETQGTVTWEEGCLSFPGVSEEISRAERVRVRALDAQGRPFELETGGLLAVAIQHENDHLDGVLMVDKLGPIKRRLIGNKMAKLQPSPE
jgi:peptide deformylase